MSKPHQFPLPLKIDTAATFNNFWPDKDRALFRWLQSFSQAVKHDNCGANAVLDNNASDETESWIYIAGPRDSGKSHLLQAVSSQSHSDNNVSALYFSFQALISQSADNTGDNVVAELFEAFELYSTICLDDTHLIGGNAQWEEALFYLLVKLKNRQNSRLIMAANNTPASAGFKLPDLISRLNSATIFSLRAYSDEDKVQIISHRAGNAGLSISEEVAAFIVNRYSRKLSDLLQAIDQLDSMGLSQGRRVTIPFVKEVLSI